MSSPHRPIAASKSRGRYSRLSRVFLMSGLGAIVLGAAFWPPDAVEHRLAVRLTFDEGLSEVERQAKLAEVQAAVLDEVELARWAADAEVEAKPRPFVFAKLVSILPKAVRAEATLAASPIESDGTLTGVEMTFADSDGLRADRFAQAIVRTFAPCSEGSVPAEEAAPIAVGPTNPDDRERALASIRRKQDELRKALDEHFEELRSLRSKVSGEVGSDDDAPANQSTAGTDAAPNAFDVSDSNLRTVTFAASTKSNVLWQVSPSESLSDLERRLAGLDADIAAKKATQEDLLSKFTAHHPVATALGIAIERLERERRDLAKLLAAADDAESDPAPPSVAPQPAVQEPVSSVQPPATLVPEPAAPPAMDIVEDRTAEKSAAAEVVANQQAVAAALERAIRSERGLQEELRALAEASESLASRSPAYEVALQPGVDSVGEIAAPTLHAEIVEPGPSERVGSGFAILVAGSLLFACLMTGLAWMVGRERAVASADEIRLASGLPVVGQSSAGLLDRKPQRNFASLAVMGSLKLVEGAAFATAVFCVAALAAENPRCAQILRQPLAVAWQALQSLT